ncbi:MAG: MaoC family dehydratase [Chitinophagales bacterium]|nr:MaoC family dehydratase [Hyphomicrobiales bacterium]
MYQVGHEFSKPYVFTAENIRRFAEEAGDDNPYHRDETKAAASRFGGIIASGPHMSAVLMAVCASSMAGKRDGVGLDFNFRFIKAIPAGTSTSLAWTVTGIEPHAGLKGDLVTLDGRIVDEAGKVYVTCQARTVVWPDKAGV